MTFTYLPIELEHLDDCIEVAFFMHHEPTGHDLAAYYRHCAILTEEPFIPGRQRPVLYCGYAYPHPNECEVEPSTADYLEMADAADCGMTGGEELI